jgi:hypothetical protein
MRLRLLGLLRTVFGLVQLQPGPCPRMSRVLSFRLPSCLPIACFDQLHKSRPRIAFRDPPLPIFLLPCNTKGAFFGPGMLSCIPTANYVGSSLSVRVVSIRVEQRSLDESKKRQTTRRVRLLLLSITMHDLSACRVSTYGSLMLEPPLQRRMSRSR